MSSRKRGNSENIDLYQLLKKVKSLEKKVDGRKRRRVIEDSSSSCSSATASSASSPARSRAQTPDNLEGGKNSGTEQVPANVRDAPLPRDISSPSRRESVVVESQAYPTTSATTADALDENLVELDSSILEILGEDPTVNKTYGSDIQRDLAVRFEHIATQGLSKETRKELLDKYLVPKNCTLIDAPAVNPEIKGAISFVVSKRTKAMEFKQKQLACAISGLGQVITRLINNKDSNPEILKSLMDVGRLLCDCQYNDSTTRKGFILSTLKKDMKDQIESTKIDKFLFGSDLSETLKTAKAINKSSAELKPPPVKQPTKKITTSSKNWKAPPNRRGAASTTQKGHETAAPEQRVTRSRRAPSSRTSHAASRHSRR